MRRKLLVISLILVTVAVLWGGLCWLGSSVALSESRYYAINHELYSALQEQLKGKQITEFEIFENEHAILIIHSESIHDKGRPVLYHDKGTKKHQGFVLAGY